MLVSVSFKHFRIFCDYPVEWTKKLFLEYSHWFFSQTSRPEFAAITCKQSFLRSRLCFQRYRNDGRNQQKTRRGGTTTAQLPACSTHGHRVQQRRRPIREQEGRPATNRSRGGGDKEGVLTPDKHHAKLEFFTTPSHTLRTVLLQAKRMQIFIQTMSFTLFKTHLCGSIGLRMTQEQLFWTFLYVCDKMCMIYTPTTHI